MDKNKVLLIVAIDKPFPHYHKHFDDRVEFWTHKGKFGESKVKVQ